LPTAFLPCEVARDELVRLGAVGRVVTLVAQGTEIRQLWRGRRPPLHGRDRPFVHGVLPARGPFGWRILTDPLHEAATVAAIGAEGMPPSARGEVRHVHDTAVGTGERFGLARLRVS
jgi:hypothetical protein